jgi:hypothetical protein
VQSDYLLFTTAAYCFIHLFVHSYWIKSRSLGLKNWSHDGCSSSSPEPTEAEDHAEVVEGGASVRPCVHYRAGQSPGTRAYMGGRRWEGRRPLSERIVSDVPPSRSSAARCHRGWADGTLTVRATALSVRLAAAALSLSQEKSQGCCVLTRGAFF